MTAGFRPQAWAAQRKFARLLTVHDEGFAVFVVLSFLLIVIALVTPILAAIHYKSIMTSNTAALASEKMLSRGLLEIAATRYFERYRDYNVLPTTIVRCPKISFYFQDHSGLIDLNAATREVLTLGFESLGLSQADANKIAQEVIRFRSVHNNSALESLDLPSQDSYKHALFESTVEVLELNGTDGLSQETIDSVFTVRSGTGTLDAAALQEPLANKVKMLKETDRFFLVNDARRTNAITVTANFVLTSGHQAIARAQFGPANVVGRVAFLTPAFYNREGNNESSSKRGHTSCEEFFDPVLLSTLSLVLP